MDGGIRFDAAAQHWSGTCCVRGVQTGVLRPSCELLHKTLFKIMFRYFGSKASSASAVAEIALQGQDFVSVADAFGGLGNIGAEMKRRGCKVTTCDLLAFPNAFQHARVVCQRRPSFTAVKQELGVESTEQVADALNNSSRRSHWFEREYAEKRMFFTPENARKIGATWSLLAHWHKSGLLTESEKKFAVASFLNCVDSRANTAGTYYAFLKKFHRKAVQPFKFDWLDITHGKYAGVALHGDALECLKGKSFDLLYLDPPYNSRDYSRYYHLPESLLHLRHTEIDANSQAGQPKRRATAGAAIRRAMGLPYIQKLVESIEWKRLVLQYADGAHVPIAELTRTLKTYGECRLHTVGALCYTATTSARKQTQHVFVIDR